MNEDLKNDPRYQNHETRPDLAGEHPRGDFYQFLAMIVFIAALAADYFWIGLAPRIESYVNFWIRLSLGGLVALFGGWLALKSIRIVFSRYTEYPRMITHHMFSFVRHPVYLGAMLMYIGVLIFTLSPVGLLAFVGVFFLYDWLARDEEARMEKVFGERYLDYKQEVPRWLPKFHV